MKKVYFIGAGPGDPELLTLRGAGLLQSCATVYAFSPYGESFATLLAGKTLYDPFDFAFDVLLERLQCERRRQPVAFLVPGDQTWFFPFQGLIEALGDGAQVVPGVSSANAASALLKRTLNLSGICSHTLILSPRTLEETPGAPALESLAAPGVTLVIYMNHLPLADLVARLRQGYGRDEPIALLQKIGLPDQRVVCGTLDTIQALWEASGTCSKDRSWRSELILILVGASLTAAVDSGWWDLRRGRDGSASS